MASMLCFMSLFSSIGFLYIFVLTASVICKGQCLACIVYTSCIGDFLVVCTGTILIRFPHAF